MSDEVVNYKHSIAELRNQIHASGRKAKELDSILNEIDAPLWSISLNSDLLKKINRAVGITQTKSDREFDRLLDQIVEI